MNDETNPLGIIKGRISRSHDQVIRTHSLIVCVRDSLLLGDAPKENAQLALELAQNDLSDVMDEMSDIFGLLENMLEIAQSAPQPKA